MTSIDEDVKKVILMINKIPKNYQYATQGVPYYNMTATLTDAVLQAGVNYKSVVYPRIYNILKQYGDYKTTCDFIILLQTIPIAKIINWKNVNKQNTICELAWLLYNNNVNNETQLAKWIQNSQSQDMLLGIKGIGFKTVDYLKLLSGLDTIPIDRHMLSFLEMSNVVVSGYKEASQIMREVAKQLETNERILDRWLWNYMSDKNNIRQLV